MNSLQNSESTLKDQQKINEYLIETFQERESVAKQEVEKLRETLSGLQIAFDDRE